MLCVYSGPSTPPRRPRRRRTLLGKIVLTLATLSIVAVVAGVGLVAYWLSGSPTLRKAAVVVASGGLNPDKAFNGKKQVNILLLGKDEDRDNHKRVLKTRGRTDTIIVARADFDARRVSLLSIPRDCLVRIPGRRGRHKINSANQLGGPPLASETVSDLLGVPIDGHMLVNYSQFARIVDMCGGVWVKVDKQLDYDDNWGDLHIHLKPGYQHLNGQQALGYVRFRKSNDGVGDTDQERIARQQSLVSSLRREVMQPSNLFKAPAILEAALGGANTTLELDQAMCLANLGRMAGGTGITAATLPGTLTPYAIDIDEREAKRLVDQLFRTNSAAGDSRATSRTPRI